MTSIVSIFSLTLLAATNGFAAEQIAPPTLQNYEALGNLESTRELGCVATEKLSNKLTPADLYKSSLACTNQGKYKEGAVIFALAGVYGRFDTLRVSDQSAHQGLSVLKMQVFSSMLPEQQNELQASITKMATSPKSLAAVCQAFVRIGPPEYFPRYMIQHGMGAFKASNTDDGIVKGFNPSAAWTESLDSYLHCKNL